MPSQSHLLDRQWLEGQYLPSLRGSVLFVGVRKYNAGYHKLVQDPELFETVDPDTKQAKFGAPYHHPCTAEELIDGGYCYDHIAAFGLVGCPDSRLREWDDIVTMIKTLATGTTKTLMFGASTDTIPVSCLWRMFEEAIPYEDWEVIDNYMLDGSGSPMFIIRVRRG